MQYSPITGHIVCVLRNTLTRLEEGGTFDQHDPAFIHLKRQLVLAIAELEVQKNSKSSDIRQESVVVLRVRRQVQPERNAAESQSVQPK